MGFNSGFKGLTETETENSYESDIPNPNPKGGLPNRNRERFYVKYCTRTALKIHSLLQCRALVLTHNVITGTFFFLFRIGSNVNGGGGASMLV